MKKDMRELRTFGVASWVIGTGIVCLMGWTSGLAARADRAHLAATPTEEGGRITVEVEGVEPEVPVFFSAEVEQTVSLGPDTVSGLIRVRLKVVQGVAEVLTLGLSGDGEVVDVAGPQLRHWSIRHGSGLQQGHRFLDLHVEENPDEPVSDLEVVISTRVEDPEIPGAMAILILAPGDTVGFSSSVWLDPGDGLDLRVEAAPGMVAVRDEPGDPRQVRFQTSGHGRIEVSLARRGGFPAAVELVDSQLTGVIQEANGSVAFRLRGRAVVREAGSRLQILSGQAGITGITSQDAWSIELVETASGFGYNLVFASTGTFPVDLTFAARVQESEDWRKLAFHMPAGAVVPITLKGLPQEVEFGAKATVVPVFGSAGWEGFVPGNGVVSMAWKQTRETGMGELFYTSHEQADIRVGGGLIRQVSNLEFRVLQGELSALRLRLDGAGEILGVEGDNILAWTVIAEGDAHFLDVRYSRPVEDRSVIKVRSQVALASMPATGESLRLVPVDSVRHSGMVRLANRGAVRLEVIGLDGLLQMEPNAYGGEPIASSVRQVFVYRFPSAGYRFAVTASQIQPEVGVSQIVTYELDETDRVIQAELELDIREAPLRDWTLRVPESYTVVSVTGDRVADYALESTGREGRRALRVLFDQAVEGRQLLRFRFEESRTAEAGTWRLPSLKFPDAATLRGHIGAVAVPGYRLVPSVAENLVEIPLGYFPRRVTGLQQAWRIKETDWSAVVSVEAMGQSIEADVFHLYSLKEGIVQASVLINLFVIGAPASEWTIRVPESAGNVDVVGLNVRRDWRREGDTITVSLHQPVLGAATLLVTYDQPMSARGGVIRPGLIEPLGVQGERGYVQIVSPLQVRFDITESDEGLLRLDPLELPTEYRLLATAPTLAVYQYTSRPFGLEMDVQWYERTELVDQVVDFAQLNSVVSRDGQVVTTARFFVKTRGRKALRMVLPAETQLWEARVDGAIVNARTDEDQTLVPLAARLNPNDAVEVTLRLGQNSVGSAKNVRLEAPRLLVPTVINEWTLRGDPDRVLVPTGGNADLIAPYHGHTGFEWLARDGFLRMGLILGLALAGGLLMRTGSGWKVPTGAVVCGLALLGSLFLMMETGLSGSFRSDELSYAASVLPAGQSVTVHVANLEAGQIYIRWPGVLIGVIGVGLGLASVIGAGKRPGRSRLLAVGGIVLLAAGLLYQGRGVTLFFGVLAAVLAILVAVGLVRWLRVRGGSDSDPTVPAGGLASLGIGLALVGLLALDPTDLSAREIPTPPVPNESLSSSAESMRQNWLIREGRLFAELELVVRGNAGDSFRLLNSPATLTGFEGEGLRVAKTEGSRSSDYYVALERDGTARAKVRFELALGDGARRIPILTGPSAIQEIRVDLDQGGWTFASDAAVRIVAEGEETEGHSRATLNLGPGQGQEIRVEPLSRDTASEETVFFAEASNLFLPGPGVVNGISVVTIRPAQGRVSNIRIRIPGEFTVGEVEGDAVGEWRFDPKEMILGVNIEPQQTRTFQIAVRMQMATGALPFGVVLAPLRVLGAAGEVGMIGLGFGGDAQPERMEVEGFSAVSVDDFDRALLNRIGTGSRDFALHGAWRYGQAEGQVQMTVSPVAPEVRVQTRQVFSIDDDRLVMAAELTASIMRVGLFSLSFVLPDELEVETLSGAALSHWMEAETEGQRIVTLHLVGQTMGEQKFSMTLAGAAPEARDSWSVPQIVLQEATRQTGELLLVPGKGIRLRAVDRNGATQLDPRSIGGSQPGTLAFRLLQKEWSLGIGIEILDPWVTVRSLLEVTMREGQSLTRISAVFRVDNAAVRSLRVRLPGLSEDQRRTVRGSGTAVSDFVARPEPDLWEVRFQRGIVGETDVQIEFQGRVARDQIPDLVVIPVFTEARQAMQFVSVRGSGRLELSAGDLPHGWQPIDWSGVPADLQNRADRSVPALCYRVAEPEQGLEVTVSRHEVADALKLRVTAANLNTVLSPQGSFLTAVQLRMDVLEKSTLQVRLPKGARLFNTLVNGESVSVVKEKDGHLFYVSPHTESDPSAVVRFVYALDAVGHRSIDLLGPSLSTPLENVSWQVVLPQGYELDDYDGGLRLQGGRYVGRFGLEQYQAITSSVRSAEAQEGIALLEEASSLLQRGKQQEAGEVLQRASNAQGLDEASNEDARVQLRALKTQQAVLGLNTRRQRLYLDNRMDAARNEQLEQAASLNPFMQGRMNFDPRQVDQLLMGNSVEENAALRGIASRLVDQQLAAEPTPAAIEITLPERGQVLTFTRSLQVDGDAALNLELEISRVDGVNLATSLFALIGVAITAAVLLPRKKNRL